MNINNRCKTVAGLIAILFGVEVQALQSSGRLICQVSWADGQSYCTYDQTPSINGGDGPSDALSGKVSAFPNWVPNDAPDKGLNDWYYAKVSRALAPTGREPAGGVGPGYGGGGGGAGIPETGARGNPPPSAMSYLGTDPTDPTKGLKGWGEVGVPISNDQKTAVRTGNACSDPNTSCVASASNPKPANAAQHLSPAADDPNTCKKAGSIVECQTRTLGELIDLPGTGAVLHYRSDNMLSNTRSQQLHIPVYEPLVDEQGQPKPIDPNLLAVTAAVTMEGKRVMMAHVYPQRTFKPEGTWQDIAWDGLNDYGGSVTDGAVAASATTYVYRGEWLGTAEDARNLENRSSMTFDQIKDALRVRKTVYWRGALGGWDPRAHHVGGWTLSVQHHLNLKTLQLRLGTGETIERANLDCLQGSFATQNCTLYGVTASDGDEYYVFDEVGNHLYTRDTLLGAVTQELLYETVAGKKRLARFRSAGVSTLWSKLFYNAAGEVEWVEGPYGARYQLEYYSYGYLRRVTDPDGGHTNLTYRDTGGLLVEKTDPEQSLLATPRSHHFDYECSGALNSDSSPDQKVQILTGLRQKGLYQGTHTTGAGVQSSFKISSSPWRGDFWETLQGGEVVSSVQTQPQNGVTETLLPTGVMLRSVESPDLRFAGVPRKLSSRVTFPDGRQLINQYDEDLILDNPTDPFSVKSYRWTVDQYSGPEQRRSSVIFSRDQQNVLVSESAEGRHSERYVDAQGRVLVEQLPKVLPISYGYDNHGQLKEIRQGTRILSTELNAQGQVQRTLVSGKVIETISQYNGLGQPKVAEYPDGGQLVMTYNRNGAVTQMTTPGGAVHQWSLSPGDQADVYMAPDSGGVPLAERQTQYSYTLDRNPRLTTSSSKNGTLHYDARGRLQGIDGASTSPSYEAQRFTTLHYQTGTGLLESIENTKGPALAFTYTYGLPESVTWSGAIAGRVSMTYDPWLRTRELSVNGVGLGQTLYDRDDLLLKVGDLQVARDPDSGRMQSSTYRSSVTQVGYDPDYGYINGLEHRLGATRLYTLSEQHQNDQGWVDARKVTDRQGITTAFAYQYDRRSRVTEARETRQGQTLVRQYHYDTNGNRTYYQDATRTLDAQQGDIVIDAQDRLRRYGHWALDYTPEGDLTQLTDTPSGEKTDYRYAVNGELIGIDLANGAEIVYLVDAVGRRVGEQINGTLKRGWLYADDIHPIAEVGSDGKTVTATFVYGAHALLPELMNRNGRVYRLLPDALGSLHQVVEMTSGTVVQRTTYDEYGNITDEQLATDPATGQPFEPLIFGYAGGLASRNDPLKLVHFGTRDYAPELGRWIGKDRIGFQGGDTNLYAYVGNNPVNAVDPKGEFPLIVYAAAYWIYANPVVVAGIGIGISSAVGAVAGRIETGSWWNRGTAKRAAQGAMVGVGVSAVVVGGGTIIHQRQLLSQAREQVAVSNLQQAELLNELVDAANKIEKQKTLLAWFEKWWKAFEDGGTFGGGPPPGCN